ncbi:MAG: tRNA preQ1(34) S-adenosylmethionine ribosyltransferase-isomerase QueA [Rhizobiales bacterium]|nr:tRNA preQ1(34) S-adenosylmethionine ribosyltransferase-isomerase QueA [Hyphomicrobiales bacterium]
MLVDLFDFELPKSNIALRPLDDRAASKLLMVDPSGAPVLSDHAFHQLTSLLQPGDLLVANDTRVIPSRLRGIRKADRGTAHIEVTLHMRLDPSRWLAFARPAKRLHVGDRINFSGEWAGGGNACFSGNLDALVEARGDAGEVTLAFDFAGSVLDDAIAAIGEMPLPPYIAGRRPTDKQDATDYQTVYAKHEGAVAAPTAGLHFTPELITDLRSAKIDICYLTLHVGAGTFLPIKVDDTDNHKMHAERGEISQELADQINETRKNGGRIVAVGTTSLRLLESAADKTGTIHPFSGPTDIFITPGYKFRAVDVLITNFHLPRSTLFMLVSAFSGTNCMKAAYNHAIESDYRFYSYGDACLIFPEKDPS